jgi:hypothetical protein
MTSNIKKTIHINPELFKIQTSSKSKTKNNRDKKKSEKQITPNFLKKQLIERIKNHKNKLEMKEVNTEKNEKNDEDDEYLLSMNFLSSVSEEEKNKQSIPPPQKKIEIIPNIPNIPNIQEIPDIPNVSNIQEFPDIPDIPDIQDIQEIPEIQEISQNVNINLPQELVEKYKPPNDLPWGCLKNGKKQTYRNWLNSHKNETLKKTPQILISESPSFVLEREKKLNDLKNKFKEVEPELEKETIKEEPKLIKRIIKKKYTLGKSKIQKKVSILIKNTNTRKKIIDSQKELKTHDIQDIKKYLRNKGLIKIGNYTPNDILRKIFQTPGAYKIM